jgi:GT2 family glycosyltransferase
MRASDITVGIATCGRGEALGRCLAALSRSSEPPGEVIVVDQDPSEETERVVRSSGLPRVRYLRQARLGLSASRNLALAGATRPTLAVTDDDCAPDPGWVAVLAAALGREPRPGAVTGAILPLGQQSPGTYSVSLRDGAATVDHRGRMLPWIPGSGANFAAPTELLRELGGWDERLGAGSPGKAGEDSELLDRLLRAGRVVRYEPEAVVRHEWQTLARRLSTRWSYGYGIGTMCGLLLRSRDRFALRILAGYARLHLRPLLGATVAADRMTATQHLRALLSIPAGVAHGLRAPQRPLPAKSGSGGA